MMTATPKTASAAAANIGSYRWRILSLLFIATTINYMDRSVLGVLGPTLQYKVFAWSDSMWANINIAFKAAYAIGMLSMGAIIDRYGTKIGYTLAIVIWSVFGMLHAAVRPAFGYIGFLLARFGLGFGESGNFPAAIKTVAEWFPKRERAFATGIFNAGSNVGAILAPLVIPLFVLPDGTNWQFAFLTTGIFSALWVLLWVKTYRRPEVHPSVTPGELAYINSDSVAENVGARIPWSKVLPLRETWAFAAAKITDAVWWFYLFWGGKYLYDRFGLDIKGLALPLIIIYVVADGGSVFGGWFSSFFIKRGWPVNKARKTTLLLCALSIMPVMFVTQIGTRFNTDEHFFAELRANGSTITADEMTRLQTIAGQSYGTAKDFLGAARTALGADDIKEKGDRLLRASRSDSLYWIAVWLIALGAAGHQAWSANIFTLVSDVFPKNATASVTGIGGMVGAVAGMIADASLGSVLTSSGPSGYFFAFLIAGSSYLILLGVAHVLMPKMTPLDSNLRRVET